MGIPGPRTTARYSEHFKATAVGLSRLSGVCGQGRRRVSLHPPVHVVSLAQGSARGLIVAKKKVELDADVAAELKELRKLKKAHERLLLEHDLLKKAIEFTSKPRPTSSPSSIIMKRRDP